MSALRVEFPPGSVRILTFVFSSPRSSIQQEEVEDGVPICLEGNKGGSAGKGEHVTLHRVIILKTDRRRVAEGETSPLAGKGNLRQEINFKR